MTNEDGAALAAAWNSWCESTEGQKCLNADTLCTGQHEYLKNRLWRAFMDGAALRSPAPGAAAMREACLNAVRKCNVIGSRGSADGWFGGVLAALEQVEADIRALPAPEVPEAVYCTLCGRETQHEPIPVMPETSTGTTLPAPEVPGDGIERDWFDSSDAVTGAGDK